MKTILKLAAIGVLLSSSVASAQSDFETFRPKESIYIFNYEVSSAVGGFSDDFISDTSWRGFSFEGRSMVNERISVGLGFNFNRFDQTYSLLSQPLSTGGTLTGPVYRYADQLAMKALVHAYLRPGAIKPYLGVGLGGVWTYSYSQSADFARADDGFDFIASPEVGLLFTAAKGASSVGLNVAFRYNYTTADFQSVNDAQSLAFVIGLFGSY
jgi:hypothetical protein